MKKQHRTKKTEVLAPYEKEEPLRLSDVKCAICFNIFIDPVTLPCKHTICLRCFYKFIRETSINCPYCRRRLSTWSRSAIKENKLVNHIFYERLKKEFPTKVAARLKEIEKEDAELRSSQDTIDEAGQVKENGLGSGDETDFECSQTYAPIVRDGDFSKPGEFGQELRHIYSQHQQDLDRERQKRALEEENASQSLILELLRQDQLSTQNQLESDLRLARILAEQDNMKPDILPDSPSLLSGNFFTTESQPTESHYYEQNISVISSEGQVKDIPKSKSNGKPKAMKGIAKAPKRRQPLVRNSSSLAVPNAKRPRIRGRQMGASSKNTLDKNQAKIGNYFSPATATTASSSFSSECTPMSMSQNCGGYFSGSNKTLSCTDSPTSQSNITVLNYDSVTESLNPEEELPGPSWRSQRANSIDAIEMFSPIEVGTICKEREISLTSPISKRVSSQTNRRGLSNDGDDNNNNLHLSPSRLHLSQMSLEGRSCSSKSDSWSEDAGASSSQSQNIGDDQFEQYRLEAEALERYRMKMFQEDQDRQLAEKLQKDFMSGSKEFRGRGGTECYSIRNWTNSGKGK